MQLEDVHHKHDYSPYVYVRRFETKANGCQEHFRVAIIDIFTNFCLLEKLEFYVEDDSFNQLSNAILNIKENIACHL